MSLQNRLMALFVIPGIFIIITIPLLLSLYQDFIFLQEQLGLSGSPISFAVSLRFLGLIVLLITIILLLYVLTLLLGRSILTPLDDLRISLTTYQIGRNTRLIDDDRKDEFGELIRSLNRLAQQLTSSYINLEKRIDQRTQALAQRAAYLQAAADLARDTTSITDIDELLDRSVNLILERFDLFFAGIYLLDPSSNQAILRSGTGEIGKELIKRGQRYHVGEIGLVGQVVTSGESRIVNDVSTDFVYQRNYLLDQTNAQAVFPLLIGNQIVGVLDLHHATRGGFDTSAISVLQIMADQLTVAIKNASLVEDLNIRIQETNMLYQRYAQDNWSVMNLKDNEIGYEFDRFRTMQYQEQIPAELKQILAKGKPVLVDIPDQEKSEKQQILYVPLIMYKQLIGLIGLEQPDDRNLGTEEIATLDAITNQISLALDNSRLLEETQRRSDQIRLLQGVTSIAASNVVLKDLLAEVSIKLRQDMSVDFCDVLWFDPDGISAMFIASASAEKDETTEDIVNSHVPVAENPLLQQLIETNYSLILYELEHNPMTVELREMSIRRGLVSILVMPLVLRGEVNGAILLCNKDDSRRFSHEDLNLMNQISLQLSSALEVARIFEQTAYRAEREMQISLATQKIRETLDIPTIIRSAAHELRQVLDVPEVTVRITGLTGRESGAKQEK
jgi:GAF domain-containing protein/HAMP domain-containing protein